MGLVGTLIPDEPNKATRQHVLVYQYICSIYYRCCWRFKLSFHLILLNNGLVLKIIGKLIDHKNNH